MTEAFPRGNGQAASPPLISPGLTADSLLGPAFELKFHLPAVVAEEIESWARQTLTPDPMGRDGSYRVTSLYCDTDGLDVFHRSPGFRRSKYRLRRYGGDGPLFLERKSKWGDRVQKRRSPLTTDELAFFRGTPAPLEWVGAWFLRRTRVRCLRPTCRVSYWRSAFFGQANNSPVRLTLDRHVVGIAESAWDVPTIEGGRPLVPDGVLLEPKFHTHMPRLFQELLPRLPQQSAKVSKYRRCVEWCGLSAARNGHVPAPLREEVPDLQSSHTGPLSLKRP